MKHKHLMIIFAALVAATALGWVDPASAMLAPFMLQTAAEQLQVTQPVTQAQQPVVIDTKWLGENVPDDVKGYVQNKGWKDAMAVVESTRNLEKLVGEKRIALPKDENDAEGYGKLYEALGRPKSAAEYKLPVPEGGDPKLATWASNLFHKAGLSTKQATAIATEWNATQAQAAKDAETAHATKAATEIEQLKGKWGGAYTEREEVAKRAVRTFGADSALLDQLEKSVMGSAGLMEFFYRVGHALGEHGAQGMGDGKQPAAGALTPEQAKEEIGRLKADTEWAKKYAAGGAEEKKRMALLHAWAYPT